MKPSWMRRERAETQDGTKTQEVASLRNGRGLRIAVDAGAWNQPRGYGRQARALLRALVRLDRGNHYTFYLDTPAGWDTLPPEAKPVFVQPEAPSSAAAYASGRRSLADMARMAQALSSAPADLILFPTMNSYVPVWSRALKVVMIHDVIGELIPELALPRRSERLLRNAKVTLGRRQADALVTVSEYARQEIVAHFGLQPEQVFVAGQGGNPIFRRLENPRLPPALAKRISPEQQLVVYAGGFSPHKNLPALVSVFARLAAEPAFADARLVLVGEYQQEEFHAEFAEVWHQAVAYGLGERVLFIDSLPEAELATLLNLSAVLVLPSLMEGLGLPAVEAAACGCPVIATTASPLPALLGEGGLYVDPQQPEELEAALRTVLNSPELRSQMGQAGLEAAGRLTWEAAARQMQAVIAQVANERARQPSRSALPIRDRPTP